MTDHGTASASSDSGGERREHRTGGLLQSAGGSVALAGAAAAMLLAAHGCSAVDAVSGLDAGDDGSEPAPTAETGTLSVSLTDAPDTLLASAVVHIGRVEAVPAGEEDTGDQEGQDGNGEEGEEGQDDGGPVVIVEEGGSFDLLTLQDGVRELLGQAEVEPDTFAQLRFIVDSARVELKEGLTFRDGSRTRKLKVPSGAQTGIKLNLDGADGDESDGGTEVEAGEETSLVVDFDVSQSFVVQGNPNTPAGIRGFLFKPVLRVVEDEAAGSIAGTVSAPEGVDVEGRTVTAEPAGGDGSASVVFQQQEDDAGQTDTATATTGEDGSYELGDLAPGDYTVSVEPPDGFTADPASRDVTVAEGEAVEGVDFELVEASGSGS